MQLCNIDIPEGASEVIGVLHKAGYEAYVVGGCVRDSIIGKKPKDWDICTSATPEQIIKCLDGYKVVETGIKHGTVTVVTQYGQYEVTTFRVDGKYSDHRRPDNVSFTSSLSEDLARRDFTINAMAYSQETGVLDFASGQDDLRRGLVRCVGDPDERFKEDALRILRAMRFASVYGFTIEPYTEWAMRKNVDLLEFMSMERIRDELCKMLVGRDCDYVLHKYSDIVTRIIPELKPCVGFHQNNRYHCYTVYDHIARAVSGYIGTDIAVNVALLLHDIGKPECYTEDEKGGHFKGHAAVSHRIAEPILERLRFDNKTKKDILELVLYHDAEIKPTPKVVKKWLSKVGEDQFKRMLDLRMADIYAHSPGTQVERMKECAKVRAVLDEVLEQQQCFTLKDMHINGDDIINLGVLEGKEVGEILRYLLDEVIAGNIQNKHHDLTMAADLEIYRRSHNEMEE